ncbi:MAG: replicative DNA helicase [Elusimicrobia bacterium]|nr:replicative DNA helicase [Elusimicrobiota bacterium]
MPETIQVPPQALEAEKAVLGSMLIERAAVETGVEQLDEKNFYADSHQKIFRAAVNLYERNMGVDVLTLTDELRRLNWLGEVGGPTYLLELSNAVSTAAHAEYYARLVKDKAILRELIHTATKVVQSCYAEEKEPGALLDEAQAQILNVAQKQTTVEYVSARELASKAVEDIEMFVKRKAAVTGIATGISKFDKLTAGLQKGNLIVIAARPGQGKSALALNIAANAVLNAESPKSVAFFSLEMSGKELVNRIIASKARVNLHELRTGYFPKDKWTHITNAAAQLHDAPLFVVDTGYLTVMSLRAIARRLASHLRAKGKSLDLIIVDYLQLMAGPPKSESRQQAVADISRGLKFLSRDLDVPVIALSQLNRRTEDKGRPDGKPQLSDLRESGAIEQDADLVALIYREGQYKPQDPTLENKAEIIIAKQRNGPTGSVDCAFYRQFSLFDNLDTTGDAGPVEEQAFEEPSFLDT